MTMFLLGLHAVSLAAYTLLIRKNATNGVNRYELAAFMQTAIAVPALFLLPGAHMPSFVELLALIGSAILIAGVHLTAILSLERIEASVFSILFNLRLIFITVLAALLLGEYPTLLQAVGGLLILAGIIFVNTGKQARLTRTALVIGLFATVWFSVHAVLERYNVMHSGLETYMLLSQGLACVLLWVIVAHKVRDFHFAKLKQPLMAATVLTRSGSAWSYLIALKGVTVAVASYISGVGVILTTLGGIVLLRERNAMWRKLFASGLAAVGVILIVAK